MKSVNEDVF